MATRTKYYVILPVLNKSFTTFRGPTWWLSEKVQFRALSEAEHRLISEYTTQEFMKSQENRKALIISDLPKDNEKVVRNIALSAQVSMNLVSAIDPVIFTYGYVVGSAVISQIKSEYEFGLWGDSTTLSKQKYKITTGVSRAEVSELYNLTMGSLNKTPSLRVTYNRFCSSLVKQNNEDKLIDLSIALESLVPGGGEFKFRFPYFLSLISETDTTERKKIFDLLEDLYDARSGLVHGSDDRSKQIKNCISNWGKLVQIASKCLFYRIVAENQNPAIIWKEHLRELAYGKANLV